MSTFRVLAIVPENLYDLEFVAFKMKSLLIHKPDSSYVIGGSFKKGFDGYVVFTDGSFKPNTGAENTKYIRFDNIPLVANVSTYSHFPKKKLKLYNGKPLNNLKHLDNWIGSLMNRGLTVNHIEYKFKTD